jgi:hypothetical protein
MSFLKIFVIIFRTVSRLFFLLFVLGGLIPVPGAAVTFLLCCNVVPFTVVGLPFTVRVDVMSMSSEK